MRAGALSCLLVLAAVTIGYAPALRNDLVWDDRIHILENPAVREARWEELLVRPVGSYYRPVVFATFALEILAAGEAPALFHATNLALHTLVACLLMSALRALGAERGTALAAALLFALHPVQSEAVLYVSGRTDLLAAAFALGTLLLHARAAGWRNAKAAPAARVAAALCFALSLGCKESLVALPLALAIGDRVLGQGARGSPRRALPGLWPYALVLAAFVGWRTSLEGEALVLAGPGDWPARLAAASAAVASYARLLVFPVGLHLERFVSDQPAWRWVVGLVLIACAVLGARRARPTIRFWSGWAAAAYLPTSNLVPVYPGLPPGVVFAPEHFLYLPSTGIAAVASLAAAGRMPRRAALAGLAAILVAFALVLHDRARDWRDEETLYTHTLAFAPESARVRLNLGNLYLARGDVERAASAFASGLEHQPDDPDLLTNAGVAWMALGRFPEAERALRRAVALEADDAQAWANLAAVYGRTGRWAQARRAYAEALARDPENADARAGMRMLDERARPEGRFFPSGRAERR